MNNSKIHDLTKLYTSRGGANAEIDNSVMHTTNPTTAVGQYTQQIGAKGNNNRLAWGNPASRGNLLQVP